MSGTRRRPSTALVALLASFAAPPLAAQSLQFAGLLQRSPSNVYTRGLYGSAASEMLQRFDADDLTGFGVEAGQPGSQVVRGAIIALHDFGGSNPNTIDVTLYTEDPARPGYPDLQHPLGGLAGVPPTPGLLTVTVVVFPTPVLAPVGRDLFVGVRVPPQPGSIGTGIYLAVLSGTPSGSTYDLPGAGLPTSPPEANNYRCYRDLVANTVTYGATPGQFLIDLLTLSPSGMPCAITNQASYSVSTIPPGTTTLLSGLHPDAASPPRNAGRADDVAFMYTDVDLAPGSPVAFLAAFGGFGPIVPLDGIVPGSVGGICLDQPTLAVLTFGVLDAGHSAYVVTTIPAGLRPTLAGLRWAQQAVGFDATLGTLRATQCGMQRF